MQDFVVEHAEGVPVLASVPLPFFDFFLPLLSRFIQLNIPLLRCLLGIGQVSTNNLVEVDRGGCLAPLLDRVRLKSIHRQEVYRASSAKLMLIAARIELGEVHRVPVSSLISLFELADICDVDGLVESVV